MPLETHAVHTLGRCKRPPLLFGELISKHTQLQVGRYLLAHPTCKVDGLEHLRPVAPDVAPEEVLPVLALGEVIPYNPHRGLKGNNGGFVGR